MSDSAAIQRTMKLGGIIQLQLGNIKPTDALAAQKVHAEAALVAMRELDWLLGEAKAAMDNILAQEG